MDDDNAARRREVSTLLRVALRTGAEVVTCANDFLEGEDPPPDEEEDDDEDADDADDKADRDDDGDNNDDYDDDDANGNGNGQGNAPEQFERGAPATASPSGGQYVPLGAAAAVGIFRNSFGQGVSIGVHTTFKKPLARTRLFRLSPPVAAAR